MKPDRPEKYRVFRVETADGECIGALLQAPHRPLCLNQITHVHGQKIRIIEIRRHNIVIAAPVESLAPTGV